jgi:hypothetical protein
MKHKLTAMLAGVLCAGLLNAAAAEAKIKAGPRGGRILEKTSPEAEFFIEKDRTVSIQFYDGAGKVVPAVGQEVTVYVDGPNEKSKLEFEQKENALVSKKPLPAGDGPNLVVQIKQGPNANPQNFRFRLDTHVCGGCKRAEYACTCDH